MTRKSILLFIFVMLVDYYVLARRPSCPMCSPKLCPKPKNCKGGTVMDFCNCCLVCAKVEGEMCGGKWMIEGRCDAKLTCVPRDRHHRSPWTNIGHCEPAACARQICGFRQECTLNRRGHPHCVCPRNCRNRPVIPVCGYSNGKQYNNDCELYRHECKSRRAITLMHGPCKKCVYKGQKYKFDDIRPGQSSCELCVCRHGVWICRMKKNCRLRSCSQDTRSGRIISPCPPGFTCKIKIPGIPEQDIPAVGQCVSVTFTKPTVKVTSKRPVSNRPARCLMQRSKGTCRNRMNRWFFNSDRGRCVKFVYSGCGGNANNFVTKSSCRASCKKEKHRSRNSRICLQEKVVGPCRAAFERWYYDPTKGKCMMFIYGGCGGNRNNFETKQECEKVCPFGRQYPTVKQATNTTTRKANGPKCEKLTIPMCENLGYNSTSFPNSLKHKTQDEAGLEIHQFFPLVKVGCSPHLREFLCSVFAPACGAAHKTPLLPCRGLCERAKRGCARLMDDIQFTWPVNLKCNRFPLEGTQQCFNGKLQSTVLPSPTTPRQSSKCEKITIPLCVNVGYNSTSFPNSLKHKTQDVAGLEVHQFFPLVKVGCSPYINEFLCSVFAPPCSADKLTSLLPCRELCESAKRGCEKLMQGVGFTWPRWLECNKFPMEITKQCFNGKLHSTILPSLTTSRQISASGRISNNSVGAMFSCYCNNCQGELTKNKCMTSFGCFASVKLRTDGQQQKSYGCLNSQFGYMLHCTPLKARFIKVKCCKYDMCNGDMFKGKQDFFTKALPADEPQPTKLLSVATVLKVTPHTSAAKSEVCFDGHSMKSYGEREEWKPNDCTVCKCRRGQPLCVATVCRHPNCRNPVRVKGLCCPKCPRNDSSFSSETDEGVHALTGRRPETILVTINKAEERGVCEEEASGELYLLGQTWKPDDCTLCECGRDGRVSCAVQSCEGQIPDCARPVREKGQCCPVCKEKKDSDVRRLCRDSKTGSFYSTGEMWQSDECTMCKCADNKNPLAICSREKCKAVSCPKPVRFKGRCCEVCPDRVQQGCIFEGKKFLSGDFRLLADHCTLCECQEGEWRCASDRCYNAIKRS